MDNASEHKVKSFTPNEFAEICGTNLEEIIDLIKEGVFKDVQKSKNSRDIVGEKGQIIEIYQKNKAGLR